MLKIENLKKIQGRTLADDWRVMEVGIMAGENTYYFGVYQIKAGLGAVDRCKIMLERTASALSSSPASDERAYFFICDSQRTNVCGSVDWLSDMDNMLTVIEGLITTAHIKN